MGVIDNGMALIRFDLELYNYSFTNLISKNIKFEFEFNSLVLRKDLYYSIPGWWPSGSDYWGVTGNTTNLGQTYIHINTRCLPVIAVC